MVDTGQARVGICEPHLEDGILYLQICGGGFRAVDATKDRDSPGSKSGDGPRRGLGVVMTPDEVVIFVFPDRRKRLVIVVALIRIEEVIVREPSLTPVRVLERLKLIFRLTGVQKVSVCLGIVLSEIYRARKVQSDQTRDARQHLRCTYNPCTPLR